MMRRWSGEIIRSLPAVILVGLLVTSTNAFAAETTPNRALSAAEKEAERVLTELEPLAKEELVRSPVVRTVLSRAPSSPPWLMAAAWLSLEMGRPADALRFLARLDSMSVAQIEEHPTCTPDVVLHLKLAAGFAMGDNVSTRELVDHIATLPKGSSAVRWTWQDGRVYERLSRWRNRAGDSAAFFAPTERRSESLIHATLEGMLAPFYLLGILIQ